MEGLGRDPAGAAHGSVGTNSAGKSSVPQLLLLLLLLRTAESSDRQRALQLGDQHTLVDAGSFADVVHGRDLAHPLEFSLRWSLAEPLAVQDALSDRSYCGDELHFGARLDADAAQQPRTTRLRCVFGRAGEPVVDLELAEKSGKKTRKQPEFELKSASYPLRRNPGRAWPLPEPLRFYGFPDEVAARRTALLRGRQRGRTAGDHAQRPPLH